MINKIFQQLYLLALVVLNTAIVSKDFPLITNTNHEPIECLSCAFYKKEIETIGGLIAESIYFEARQDCYVPIPGFIIIYPKRHIQSIDQFNEEERKDFIEFIYQMRKAMREKLDIQIVDIIQEEESSHFHMWLFPRYKWMKEFGKRIKSIPSIIEWAQNNLNTDADHQKIKEAAQMLSSFFSHTKYYIVESK